MGKRRLIHTPGELITPWPPDLGWVVRQWKRLADEAYAAGDIGRLEEIRRHVHKLTSDVAELVLDHDAHIGKLMQEAQ